MYDCFMQAKRFLKSKIPHILYPVFLKYKYYRATGKKCNLIAPKTYTEKIQWSKLHRDNKTLALYADKIKVREYVTRTIGEQYLVPVISGVYTSSDQIDFDSLPEQFVIKANHGCGFNYVVKNKSKIDTEQVRAVIDLWLRTDFSINSLELQYRYIEPAVYIEEYLLKDGEQDLPDYKFFCFSGKVFCSYTMIDYHNDHSKGRLGFFDRNYKLMPYNRADYRPVGYQLDKPEGYDLMVELAEKLSQGFSHVRVDLYNIRGRVYFGELTFTNASGLFRFVPDEFDYILGEQWDLQKGL